MISGIQNSVEAATGEKLCKNQRKTPVLESAFNKVAGLGLQIY